METKSSHREPASRGSPYARSARATQRTEAFAMYANAEKKATTKTETTMIQPQAEAAAGRPVVNDAMEPRAAAARNGNTTLALEVAETRRNAPKKDRRVTRQAATMPGQPRRATRNPEDILRLRPPGVATVMQTVPRPKGATTAPLHWEPSRITRRPIRTSENWLDY